MGIIGRMELTAFCIACTLDCYCSAIDLLYVVEGLRILVAHPRQSVGENRLARTCVCIFIHLIVFSLVSSRVVGD